MKYSIVRRFTNKKVNNDRQLAFLIEEEFNVDIVDQFAMQEVDEDMFEQEFYDTEGDEFIARLNHEGYVVSISKI